MNHTQSLQITYGSVDSVEITHKITSLFNSPESINNINIITSSQHLLEDKDVNKSSYYYDEQSYQNLYELLESIEGVAAGIFLRVIPSEQVHVSPFLHIQNQFIVKNQRLKIFLNESSHQIIPNITHKIKGSQVKKINNFKIGHGAKQYSSINYQLEINLELGQDGKFNLAPELKYIISKLFHTVDMTISSTTPISSLRSQPIQISSLELDPSIINLSPIFSLSSITEQGGEMYEYLCLLSLDTNNEQLTVSSNQVDEFLSSYKVPSSMNDINQLGTLFRLRYKHANINSLQFIHDKKPWNVISLQYASHHIILFKDINNHISIYEVR